MRYICTNCHFVFDESLGVPEAGVDPQSSFSELNYDFVCPQCESPKEHFDLINEEVLSPDDMDCLSELEALHLPKFEIKGETLSVSIGLVDDHPMEGNHNILSILLYDEYGDLIEEKMITEDTVAECEFDVSYLDEFEIRSRCSLHGTWSSGLLRK